MYAGLIPQTFISVSNTALEIFVTTNLTLYRLGKAFYDEETNCINWLCYPIIHEHWTQPVKTSVGAVN